VDAWSRYSNELSRRKRLRAFGRPLLGLMQKLIVARLEAAGSCKLVSSEDYKNDSLVNVMVKACNQALEAKADPSFLPLPADLGERSISIWHQNNIVMTDVRQALVDAVGQSALVSWQESKSQSTLACTSASTLYQNVVLRYWKGGESFVLRLLTDTLYYSVREVDSKTVVDELKCATCDVVDNVLHLTSCTAPDCRSGDESLLATLLSLIEAAGDCEPWLANVQSLPELLEGMIARDLSLARARCGCFDRRDWKKMAGRTWQVVGKLDLEALFVKVTKVLYESVFGRWCSRQHVRILT